MSECTNSISFTSVPIDSKINAITNRLIGFDLPYGCYDDPARKNPDGTLAWPQKLGWEVRQCIFSSTRSVIERELQGDNNV